jgi:hypothetical protein
LGHYGPGHDLFTLTQAAFKLDFLTPSKHIIPPAVAVARPAARSHLAPSSPLALLLSRFAALFTANGCKLSRGLRTAAMAQTGAFYGDITSSSGVYKYLVDGEWKESSSGKTVSVINPTTQQPEYQVQGAPRPLPGPPARDARRSWPAACPCAAAAPATGRSC